jgi:SAM-dependent methyltransferase
MATAEHTMNGLGNGPSSYSNIRDLPYHQLISQLVEIALSDCTNLTILDLGGGSGAHARDAVELGASAVDIVDKSPVMLEIAESIEASLGRRGVMRFFEADVSESLSQLPLREEGYDVIMGNWMFNYADSIEKLERMFQNIVDHLKPGGLFVGVRGADTKAPALRDGKYGATYKNIKEIPGGLAYTVVLHSSPPIEFECAILDVIASGSTELHKKFGLTDVQIVPYESAEMVQKNPEFWKVLIRQPSMAVVRAVKDMR